MQDTLVRVIYIELFRGSPEEIMNVLDNNTYSDQDVMVRLGTNGNCMAPSNYIRKHTKKEEKEKPMALDNISAAGLKELEVLASAQADFNSWNDFMASWPAQIWEGDKPGTMSEGLFEELRSLSGRNHSITSFRAELAQYAELAWHNARRNVPGPDDSREHVTGSPAAVGSVKRLEKMDETEPQNDRQDLPNPDEGADSGADNSDPYPPAG